MTLVIHATTGHNNLNYMNSIIIPEYTSLCRFCKEEDQPFDHLYDDCPAFWKQRCEIQGDQNDIQNWMVRSVLNMAKLEDILLVRRTNVMEDIMKNRRQ